jgi:AcrR family transcriptional regulator
MSPYPAQTDLETIIATAIALIEREGVENLSLKEIAAELGIKTPSLYGHIASKNALLKAVIERTYRKMFAAYEITLQKAGEDPGERLRALFHAHRSFALANPNTYILAYTATDPELRADPVELEQQAIVLQQIMAQISGQEDSLSALRGALALVHGFAMLEINEQLQRGGDLTKAFDAAVNAYLRGWL